MQVPSQDDSSVISKCTKCGADISLKAKFCEECGALQPAPAAASIEPVGETLEEPASGEIEAQPSATPRFEFSPNGDTSTPPETEGVVESTSIRKKLGIAAVVIVALGVGVWSLQAYEERKARDNYNLGFAYEKGTGVPKDDAQAVSWYRKAVEHGNADAEYRLGLMYGDGRGGLAKDPALLVSWVRKAAEQGNADAEYKLGAIYMDGGDGLTKDEAQAILWWRKAADQGNADGEYSVGAMYENGLGGLTKDDAQAVIWWRKAADQGEADAEYELGLMYENGSGGLARDDNQAISWYQKAASQGYELAKDAPAKLLARRQREQQEQARMDALNGEYIDFTDLYVKGVTNSEIVGKRYRFRAEIDTYGTDGTAVKLFAMNDDSKGLSAVLGLDPDSPVDRGSLLRGDPHQVRTVVGSCCDGSAFIIQRIEYR